jgi:hypothetical protein
MPAESKKQEKFMQAVANNPKFAKKVGVKQSVGKEFTKEKGMKKVKKMQMGGLAARMLRCSEQWILEWRWRWKLEDAPLLVGGMNKGGKVKKNTAKMNNLEELGRVDAEKGYTEKGKKNLKSEKKRLVSQIKKGGSVGSASKRADGIAQRAY